MAQESLPNHTITREQKTGFVLLLVFGIFAVALGALQMRNTIYNPFALSLTDEQIDTARLFENSQTRLQQIDTDQDGLTDYEEIQFFQTSAYLPDTDSDGTPDKEEIDAGTDPLCPEGQECIQPFADDVGPQTPVGSPLFDPTDDSEDIVGLLGSATADAAVSASTSLPAPDLATIVQNPQLLRQLLEQSGAIDPAELAQIDDATLLNMAAQLLPSAIHMTSSTP